MQWNKRARRGRSYFDGLVKSALLPYRKPAIYGFTFLDIDKGFVVRPKNFHFPLNFQRLHWRYYQAKIVNVSDREFYSNRSQLSRLSKEHSVDKIKSESVGDLQAQTRAFDREKTESPKLERGEALLPPGKPIPLTDSVFLNGTSSNGISSRAELADKKTTRKTGAQDESVNPDRREDLFQNVENTMSEGATSNIEKTDNENAALKKRKTDGAGLFGLENQIDNFSDSEKEDLAKLLKKFNEQSGKIRQARRTGGFSHQLLEGLSLIDNKGNNLDKPIKSRSESKSPEPLTSTHGNQQEGTFNSLKNTEIIDSNPLANPQNDTRENPRDNRQINTLEQASSEISPARIKQLTGIEIDQDSIKTNELKQKPGAKPTLRSAPVDSIQAAPVPRQHRFRISKNNVGIAQEKTSLRAKYTKPPMTSFLGPSMQKQAKNNDTDVSFENAIVPPRVPPKPRQLIVAHVTAENTQSTGYRNSVMASSQAYWQQRYLGQLNLRMYR